MMNFCRAGTTKTAQPVPKNTETAKATASFTSTVTIVVLNRRPAYLDCDGVKEGVGHGGQAQLLGTSSQHTRQAVDPACAEMQAGQQRK
jgi:hypothetical protein